MFNEQKRYNKIQDIPTKLLATNFVCALIEAKGNINKYQLLTEMLIKELRGEATLNV